MKSLNRTLVRMTPWAAPLAALFVALPSHALYKVVGPDGKVTYTDTPPTSAGSGKVSRVGETVSVVPQANLPIELRQAISRYPVTLYTMKGCEPCDAGRQLLKQRGVPFSEKLLVTGEDGEALQRLSGSRDAPTLTIGTQVLKGLQANDWNAYLDSAGYPRESRLPANYAYPAPTPLTTPAAPPAPAAARAAEPAPAPAEPPPAPGGIRF